MLLLQFTKPYGGEVWINPEQIIYAERGRKDPAKIKAKDSKAQKDPKAPPPVEEDPFLTILHVSGKEGKVFINEHPDKINEIVEANRKKVKIEF